LDELSPWKEKKLNDEEMESLIEELRLTLVKIKDLHFVVELCAKAALPSLKAIK